MKRFHLAVISIFLGACYMFGFLACKLRGQQYSVSDDVTTGPRCVPRANQSFKVIAHGGDQDHREPNSNQGAAMNTTAAIQRAVEEDFPIVEFDINYTSDNRLVVVHDRPEESLAALRQRAANGQLFDDSALPEARNTSVNPSADQRGRPVYQVPTLEDIFHTIARTRRTRNIRLYLDTVARVEPEQVAAVKTQYNQSVNAELRILSSELYYPVQGPFGGARNYGNALDQVRAAFGNDINLVYFAGEMPRYAEGSDSCAKARTFLQQLKLDNIKAVEFYTGTVSPRDGADFQDRLRALRCITTAAHAPEIGIEIWIYTLNKRDHRSTRMFSEQAQSDLLATGIDAAESDTPETLRNAVLIGQRLQSEPGINCSEEGPTDL